MTAKQRRAKRERQNGWVKRARKLLALESSIEGRAVTALEAVGYACLKVGHSGWPDRLVLVGGGRHLWLEFKRPKFASLTPLQVRRFAQMECWRETVAVVRSVEEATRAVERFTSRRK